MSTIKLAIGVPRQEIDLLIDINSYMPFLYNTYCYFGNDGKGSCEYNNYVSMTYDFEKSVTFANYTTNNYNNNETHDFYNNGFSVEAAYGVDQFCSFATQFCWTNVVFGNVGKQNDNHWFKYQPLR